MKRNNIFLILAILAVVLLTVFLGYSLKKYYKVDADTAQKQAEDFLVPIRESGAYSLNYAEIENKNATYTFVNSGDIFVIDKMENLPLDHEKALSFADNLTTVKGAPIPSTQEVFKKYGIDGKTTITAHYIDNSTLTFRFGNPIDNKLPCYIDEIEGLYFFPADYMPHRLYRPNDFIRNTITNVTEDTEIKTLTLSGTCRPLPISLEQQPSNGNQTKYKVTEPEKNFLDKLSLESALGQVFGIKAVDAQVLNPTPEDILNFGLDQPFSIMDVSTGQESFLLKATKPMQDGTAFILRQDIAVIYKVDTKDLAWITAQYGNFIPTLFVPPDISDISQFKVTTKDKAYVFEIEHRQQRVDVSLSGKYLDPSAFEKYLEMTTSIPPKDFIEHTSELPPALTLDINYKQEDRKPDTIELIPYENGVYVAFNGEIHFSTTQQCVESILENTQNISEGKAIA